MDLEKKNRKQRPQITRSFSWPTKNSIESKLNKRNPVYNWKNLFFFCKGNSIEKTLIDETWKTISLEKRRKKKKQANQVKHHKPSQILKTRNTWNPGSESIKKVYYETILKTCQNKIIDNQMNKD
jgi:hypothetical protein